MNMKRIAKWGIGIPLVLITIWVGTLLWFNEFRYRINKPSPALAAAMGVDISEYKCPMPPAYYDIEKQLQATSSDAVTSDDIMEVWNTEMVAFEICNRSFMVPALDLQKNINTALDQSLAISQRDGLIKKQLMLEEQLVPAKRMAKRAKEAKDMWIYGEWPEAFLNELKQENPADYQLLTGKSPDQ